MHEQLHRTDDVKGPSDRSFGITFSVMGAILALWPLLDNEAPRWLLLGVVAALAAVSVTVPQILRPLNRIWLQIGLLLHRIVSPIILGIVFYGLLTPLGLAMRSVGKNPLRLHFEKDAPSYWIHRRPPGPAAE